MPPSLKGLGSPHCRGPMTQDHRGPSGLMHTCFRYSRDQTYLVPKHTQALLIPGKRFIQKRGQALPDPKHTLPWALGLIQPQGHSFLPCTSTEALQTGEMLPQSFRSGPLPQPCKETC